MIMMRIKHFFTGHRWSAWVFRIHSEGAYDEEVWFERYCRCGAIQQTDTEEFDQ